MPKSSVIGLAGRRVDREDASTSRFPPGNVGLVGERLAELLRSESAVALVCSAACGADIIALEEAERQGLRLRIILPFERLRFRRTSVIDRGGDWGPRFDRLTDLASRSGDLLVLGGAQKNDDLLYVQANSRIRQEAAVLARSLSGAPHRILAVAVWEGQPRPGNDLTLNFLQAAESEGLETRLVSTI